MQLACSHILWEGVKHAVTKTIKKVTSREFLFGHQTFLVCQCSACSNSKNQYLVALCNLHVNFLSPKHRRHKVNVAWCVNKCVNCLLRNCCAKSMWTLVSHPPWNITSFLLHQQFFSWLHIHCIIRFFYMYFKLFAGWLQFRFWRCK